MISWSANPRLLLMRVVKIHPLWQSLLMNRFVTFFVHIQSGRACLGQDTWSIHLKGTLLWSAPCRWRHVWKSLAPLQSAQFHQTQVVSLIYVLHTTPPGTCISCFLYAIVCNLICHNAPASDLCRLLSIVSTDVANTGPPHIPSSDQQHLRPGAWHLYQRQNRYTGEVSLSGTDLRNR
jgi:hypothetical protein